MNDGWKCAEVLLGVAAEALRERADYKARYEAHQRSPAAGSALTLAMHHAREAALEEAKSAAAHAIPIGGPANAVCCAIDALKSKPVPDLCPECEKPKDAHGMSCSKAVRCSSPMGTMNGEAFVCTREVGHAGDHVHHIGTFPLPQRNHLPGCTLDTDHKEGCFVALRQSEEKPEPVNASLFKPCPSKACILAGGHPGRLHEDTHGNTWPNAVQCLTPGCDRPHQHEGPHGLVREIVRRLGACPTCGESLLHAEGCSMGVAESGEMQTQPVVHDFGWALAQMRAGKKVRVSSWGAGCWIRLDSDDFRDEGGLKRGPNTAILLKTDWEVVP